MLLSRTRRLISSDHRIQRPLSFTPAIPGLNRRGRSARVVFSFSSFLFLLDRQPRLDAFLKIAQHA